MRPLDPERLAVAMNSAQIQAEEISLGHDLLIPATRVARAYDRGSSVHYPKLRVRVPEKGLAVLSTVEIDGEQWPVTRVAFDTGEDLNGLVKVRVEFYAETIDLESDAPLTVTAVEPVA